MFNLTNLLTSILLATGVANTTPIVDKQNENTIIDYTQTLTQVNTANNTYPYLNLQLPPNQLVYDKLYDQKDYEETTNYRSTSSFLNITASKYVTKRLQEEEGYNNTYIQNYYTIQNNLDNYWQYDTTTMLVMQIDSYNYNVGTTIHIRNTLDVTDAETTANGYTYEVSNRRYLKQVYRTSEDWSEYLQVQARIQNAQQIRNAIENVNNNWFYTKEQSLTNVVTFAGDQGYRLNDDTELQLLPKTTNYIVIEYIPVATQTITGGSTPITSEEGNILVLEQYNGISETVVNITGTNVIPDGTYEVIDIPGLMWQILTMPFAFVSQAFNLTLFPGTPYQINISNLFLSIIAMLAFVWLISFIIRIKG